MERFFYVFILILSWSCKAQDYFKKDNPVYYPGESWEEYTNPHQLGFDSEKLLKAKMFYDSLQAASVLVLYKGKILLNWGDNTRRLRSASVRKSFLHALLGMRYDEKMISLEDELGNFKIDEFMGLNNSEKTARIKDLLSTSSGVYLPAAYEPKVWTDGKPERGSHKPGAKWYYNNWDFNALGTIYGHVTHRDIGEDFNKRIAIPIGMQDFRPGLDFKYFYEQDIAIPAYLFKMSARDMARFGLLYLRNGKWKGKQLISKEWVKMGTTEIKTPWEGTGYGYLWWTTKTKNGIALYYASGSGVQGIYIVPSRDLVMVFRSDTYLGPEVQSGMELALLTKILEAQDSVPQKTSDTKIVTWNNHYALQHDAEKLRKWIGSYTNNITHTLSISIDSDRLVLHTKIADFLMLPLSGNTFWIEDLNVIAEFKNSDTKKHTSLLTKDKLILYN